MSLSENDLLLDGMRKVARRRRLTEEDAGRYCPQGRRFCRDALSLLEQCINAGDELYNQRELVLTGYTGGAGDVISTHIELTDF